MWDTKNVVIVVTCSRSLHMTSRPPYSFSRRRKRWPCWCPKPVLWDLNSLLNLLCKNFLLLQWIYVDAGHVSENTLKNRYSSKHSRTLCNDVSYLLCSLRCRCFCFLVAIFAYPLSPNNDKHFSNFFFFNPTIPLHHKTSRSREFRKWSRNMNCLDSETDPRHQNHRKFFWITVRVKNDFKRLLDGF